MVSARSPSWPTPACALGPSKDTSLCKIPFDTCICMRAHHFTIAKGRNHSMVQMCIGHILSISCYSKCSPLKLFECPLDELKGRLPSQRHEILIHKDMTNWIDSAIGIQGCCAPLYSASSSPLALSSSRSLASRQEASTQLPSWESAIDVTGACIWSTYTQPPRTSKRRTVPSTLAARISALRHAHQSV